MRGTDAGGSAGLDGDAVVCGANGVSTGHVIEGESAGGAVAGSVDGAPFPVVAIGASAGGLDAFTQLLTAMPADTGMAFVLIQHLDPSHKSILVEALAKVTAMPVDQARHGLRVEPDHVYLIPPEADLSIVAGALILSPRTEAAPRPHLPIDVFCASLAGERGLRAIGVVLSGTASDGTEGLRAIKDEGGITFAQDPNEAKFDGMPRSAIEAGVVDYALPIDRLAEELARLSRHPYLAEAYPEAEKTSGAATPEPESAGSPAPRPDPWAEIFPGIVNIVRAVVGVDFREYKAPTFTRRLARRMALRRTDSQARYLELLNHDPVEVRALCEEALIHVSSFFRDPQAFDTLSTVVFPRILEHKSEGGPIRIWVAGCSFGEEAYSIAICLLESLKDATHPRQIQIFGSDVSELAVQKARAGRFTEGAMRGVSEERRKRFFTKVDSGYRISKAVRDPCVFVRHDLARDPPFSRVDLLSCRNVLIYFDQPLQKRVLQTFHYSLTQPGFLMLGRTENIAGSANLFTPLDRTNKVFLRSASPSDLRFPLRADGYPSQAHRTASTVSPAPRRPGDLSKHLDALLLARYAPAGVLVDGQLDILQFRGQTGAYLQAAPGEPQVNLVKMARPGLLAALRAVLARAQSEMAPVRSGLVEIDQGGFNHSCEIVVIPFVGLPEVREKLFVVLFEDSSSPREGAVGASAEGGGADGEQATQIPKLEHMLSSTTEYLHSLIQEHSQINDELGAANEELISGNEELQSLNEELETAKEELQSTNEELTTVNDELDRRNAELGQVNNDLLNLLHTVDVPVVILDKARRIRRVTPQAQQLFNVLPSDIGRPFDDIRSRLVDVPNLERDIAAVIETFVSKESEVQDREGRWYRMQIRPYRDAEHTVDGAIISLVDIDVLKGTVRVAQQAQADAERSDRAKDEFLAVLSHELRTPLSVLVMQTHFLRSADLNSKELADACDRIERSTKTQVRLVDDLLDVSRIVTGKMRIDLTPTDLAAAVRASVDGILALAQSRAIEVQASLTAAGLVFGDRVRLEQVVMNLLINAVKFTPKGGRIDVVLTGEGGWAHLEVRDTGMGIDQDFLPRVFNRLTQADSSSTRSHSGLGLGLAIVRHLVEAHGGTVRAESDGPGRGATFHVMLPLITAPELGAGGAPASRRPASGERSRERLDRKILVVEDDGGLREVLGQILTRAGATVRTADSAGAGMRIFEQFRPDVLICDIAMPVEDGYAFISRIRALGPEAGGKVPALALTALAGEADRARAFSNGFQMYLTKPVDLDQLRDALAILLPPPPHKGA